MPLTFCLNGFRSFPDVDLQICTIARRPGARRLQVGTYYIGRGLSPIRTLLPVGNPPRGSHADAHAERPPHSQNAHRTAIHQHTHKKGNSTYLRNKSYCSIFTHQQSTMHPQAEQLIQKVDDFIAGYPNICQCKILGNKHQTRATTHDQRGGV